MDLKMYKLQWGGRLRPPFYSGAPALRDSRRYGRILALQNISWSFVLMPPLIQRLAEAHGAGGEHDHRKERHTYELRPQRVHADALEKRSA